MIEPCKCLRAVQIIIDRLLGCYVEPEVQLCPQNSFSWEFQRQNCNGMVSDARGTVSVLKTQTLLIE